MATESGIWYFYFKGHGHGQGQKTLMIDLDIMVGYSYQNIVSDRSFFMPRIEMSRLFVCVSVFLSVANFNFRYKRWTLHIWHAYSTNNALSNDIKVNDLVTMTDLRAKKSFFFRLCCHRGHGVFVTDIQTKCRICGVEEMIDVLGLGLGPKDHHSNPTARQNRKNSGSVSVLSRARKRIILVHGKGAHICTVAYMTGISWT